MQWLCRRGSLVSCVPKATRWHCLSSSTSLHLPSPAPTPGRCLCPHGTAAGSAWGIELLLRLRSSWHGRRNTSPLPHALGTKPKGFRRLITATTTTAIIIIITAASGLENKGTHRQEQPWCMSRDPLVGRERWLETA